VIASYIAYDYGFTEPEASQIWNPRKLSEYLSVRRPSVVASSVSAAAAAAAALHKSCKRASWFNVYRRDLTDGVMHRTGLDVLRHRATL